MYEPPDEQAAGQHYLVCGNEDCEKNGEFYCNACHRPMCDDCQDEHLKQTNTKKHQVVLYRQRRRQLPEEKCKLHPRRNLDILCKECNIPVCSKCCTTQEHQGHSYDDLEEIYAERFASMFACCQNKVSEIQESYLPKSHQLRRNITVDVTEIKNTMENVRADMESEAKALKQLVDAVTSENIEQTRTVENELLRQLELQEITCDEYIIYLENLVVKMQKSMATTSFNIISLSRYEELEIRNLPMITKPTLPIFIAGKCRKEDVVNILGKLSEQFQAKELEKSKNKPIASLSIKVKPMERHVEEERGRSVVKQRLSLSSSVTKIREYSVPGVDSVYHVSVDKLGRLWVSDSGRNLVQTDLEGILLQRMKTSGGDEGYHTVTQDRDIAIVYTERDEKVIKMIGIDKTTTEFIKTGDWTPLSVHSSHINGDLLVGMIKDGEAKITRFNKAGKQTQRIQWNSKGQALYTSPHYIAENINGDICTSDYFKEAVVVVNELGQYRFSYKGQGSRFRSWGICTNVLGHILVCDGISATVHLLDQDGQFLSKILTQNHGLEHLRSVFVDAQHNLCVGQHGSNTITVFNYLQ
uniref:Tripartite motif-containing protein 45-like n=1 Tax=Crassostrea virginica TaxID=6565 RepID=A0A8B8EZ08_CRAVI|nr:tripartite motif-containing protein 45-like [Crassostrea virginica]